MNWPCFFEISGSDDEDEDDEEPERGDCRSAIYPKF